MAEALRENHFFNRFIKMNIPDDYLDASRFRIIPDNQEVYVHKYDDKCVIIEVLCFQNMNIQEKGKFYFYDLAKENDSVENVIITNNHSVPHSQGSYTLLVGQQKIKKENSAQYQHILLYICIFPIEEHNADVLITWNVPKEDMEIHPELETFNEMVQSFRILDYNFFFLCFCVILSLIKYIQIFQKGMKRGDGVK
ncbi:ran-interacting Mog1 domain containing protein [Plasmodium cynomolgi strain B]|uniref:Ran-interacting Mog1 domain containing protein n=1 Tax=Plasmodium cynomolgi (strain B) TaxID=1120755 RepID=K6VEC8_PLACD|nr:ran-interacting Mog1 domain containing protein [Plasmodium cynomolgi strain B]GAB67607.1 ran-interacting Mog1 domain containing protein [Plasmodium cynomolgi strain B]